MKLQSPASFLICNAKGVTPPKRHFVCEILLKDKLAPSLPGLQHGAGTDSQDTISSVPRNSLDPYENPAKLWRFFWSVVIHLYGTSQCQLMEGINAGL
ncbi:Zinc finger protein 1 [Fusarium oxysporum f. sp. albedinis]|nr:Zinc finger protein 1 [Fusarium oxysporum f. sp. albedinis]